MFDQLIANIGGALQQAQIPYVVIGGHAVLLYGEPRFTNDVDIIVAVSPAKAQEIEKMRKLFSSGNHLKSTRSISGLGFPYSTLR